MKDLEPETYERIAEEGRRIAAANRAHDLACIAAAPDPVLTHWHQVADSVDEGTWQRIVDELPPHMRAEYVAYRPPAPLPEVAARQQLALNRLTRAHRQEPKP
ncbi:hypothetical protein ACFOOK_28220 [Micromonospora krabiensis]|uniref:Uncharacterized protein n=1 Tax=Micromonospora krabiensis TaxID=307121 RepID=A0A1C3N4N3_9ACTN|nr:hypothetical protein [Micromonospora krabiensis]SBV27544.1 hypothetical protein GA0070620_3068 [Micromonospora krabiensis]